MMMVKRYNIGLNKETSTKHLFYCEKLTFDFSSGLPSW